jgi:hypothetical protein
MDKIVRLEFWDTNTKILNSQIIESNIFYIKLAYFKICNCFILICDLSNFESIKFIEKQYHTIIKSSSNNIHLLVNIKQNVEQFNLEYLNEFCEKNFLKANFVNLIEYVNKNDKVFEKFINNSLVKKAINKNGRRGSKLPPSFENKEQNKNHTCGFDVVMRDSSASPVKKNDCLIF